MSVAPTIASLNNLSEQEKESEVVLVDHLTVAPEDAERFRGMGGGRGAAGASAGLCLRPSFAPPRARKRGT